MRIIDKPMPGVHNLRAYFEERKRRLRMQAENRGKPYYETLTWSERNHMKERCDPGVDQVIEP